MEILVIIWLLCGVLCYFIMKSKGYDNNTCLTHGVGGVLLGFIWLIVVLCKKENTVKNVPIKKIKEPLSDLEAVELLERLANLKERGVITETEYSRKKAEIFRVPYSNDNQEKQIAIRKNPSAEEASTAVLLTEEESYFTSSTLALLDKPEIAECAYMNNRSPSKVVLPDGLQKIGSFAFFGCADLCCIEIPASVTVVGYQAFGGCTNLSEITISHDTKFLNRENLPEGSFEDSFDGCAPDMKVNWI